MPPAVSRMSTPAIDLDTASSRTVTSRDHPPSCIRLCESPKEYLKVCTPPASVGGGKKESGFWASIGGFPGPGALALRSSLLGYCFCSCPSESDADNIPAAARAAELIPRNPRREYKSFFESSDIRTFLSGYRCSTVSDGFPVLQNKGEAVPMFISKRHCRCEGTALSPILCC